LRELPRCIGFIDGTLIEICKAWQNEAHCTWFNGWKKIYGMNNTFIMDHQGLFIYINGSYLGSFHDVNILQHLNVYKDWHQYIHKDEYFEYLLGIQVIWVRRCL
jgi:hypothetical protein